MRHIPIRWRLTGWYVLVLAAILAALTAFVVTRLRADLTADVDRSLDAAGVQIAQAYRLEGDPELAESTRDLLLNAGLGESGAQLLTADGAVRRAVGAVPRDAPLVGPAAVAAALRGDRVVATVRPPGGDQPYRVSARAVRRGGRPEVLIAADGLAERDRAVRRVLMLLVIGGAGALILVGLGGWWVARKGLSPVRAMTERAGRVDIGDLTERIPVPPADDELRRLATTLNAMLARLEAGVAARERFVADAPTSSARRSRRCVPSST